MEDIFHYESENNTIFVNEKVLLSGSKMLAKCREDEITALANAIRPLAERKAGFRLFVFGPHGSGKTMSSKYVLENLGKHSNGVIGAYINCWHYSTAMSIYHSIVKAAGWFVPRRGVAKDEVFEKIIEILEKEGKSILLVLDNLDGLFFYNGKESLDVLSELSKNRLVGLIGISSNPQLINRDSFSELEFKPYKFDELVTILRHMAEQALQPKSWDEDLLMFCAKKAEEKGGSARLALELLWKSGKLAQRKEKYKISLSDADEAVRMTFRKDDLESMKYVSQEEQIILDILKTGEKTSSELYWAFSKKLLRTKRQIRNYLKSLMERGLVETRDVQNGNGTMKPRIISIKV